MVDPVQGVQYTPVAHEGGGGDAAPAIVVDPGQSVQYTDLASESGGAPAVMVDPGQGVQYTGVAVAGGGAQPAPAVVVDPGQAVRYAELAHGADAAAPPLDPQADARAVRVAKRNQRLKEKMGAQTKLMEAQAQLKAMHPK